MKQYTSNAQWPEGTLNGYNNDVSMDFHETLKEAEGVCGILMKEGFGGDGKIFPIKTWTDIHIENIL